ncbi:MAG: ABC transporter substrate-binding protein [Prochloraceae cyanobacterium]|nr:ABC transporter substrate-binding protein [Prochloraceae cyanobacterium]
MPSRWIKIIFAFLLGLAFIACTAPTPDRDNTSSSTEPAQRVVALTSLTADIVEQLAPNTLVGSVESPLLAKDIRFQDLPKVSNARTPPNLEKIVALKPDLVIGARGFHDRALDKLQDLGIATITTKVTSWDGLLEVTKTLAKAIDADPSPLLKRYQTFLADIPDSSPSVLVLFQRQPILSPNKNSWAGDLLNKFKVKNLAASIQGKSPFRGYITLSAEKILQENPEIVLVADFARQGILQEFKSEPFWSQLQATQNGRVYIFEYYGLVNPGSINKIEETCTKLKEALASQ